jgi:hypothetical protein
MQCKLCKAIEGLTIIVFGHEMVSNTNQSVKSVNRRFKISAEGDHCCEE